jgi:hypothetical protein
MNVSGTFFVSKNVDYLPHLNALRRTTERLRRIQWFRFLSLKAARLAHQGVLLSLAYVLFLKFM